MNEGKSASKVLAEHDCRFASIGGYGDGGASQARAEEFLERCGGDAAQAARAYGSWADEQLEQVEEAVGRGYEEGVITQRGYSDEAGRERMVRQTARALLISMGRQGACNAFDDVVLAGLEDENFHSAASALELVARGRA